MSEAPQSDPHPQRIPAATAIVFRRSASGGPAELLLAERAASQRFAPGATVFPGGKVDPADHDLAAQLGSSEADPEDLAARVAAVRETLEETGLLLGVKQTVTAQEVAAARDLLHRESALGKVLAHYGWTLDLNALVPFARWQRPEGRAFDTRFYLADLGTGAVELTIDGTEHSRLCWLSAQEALMQAGRGELSLIFPTLCNLMRLAPHADFAAAASDARMFPPTPISGRQESAEGREWLTIPEGLGYPVTRFPLDDVRRA
ncbi:NUDIX domain-containing protein [Novosphingobium flavum]|uniref:NUDIX domain-containing protein n=1 Tax=Novosphingobium flavum TaxID=1778672 RepID=A0A7X1FSK1_9SPHN|nr:NUDIX domain-containing protein [Novosphingobium flavum]MBC2666175.1 NUDIX domain-containing protein [Novosphingobium flavum]